MAEKKTKKKASRPKPMSMKAGVGNYKLSCGGKLKKCGGKLSK